ncbi:MAG: hypothetical protein K6T51_12430 [Rubrobacteraceae bacterium]|uniref:hypothetical protein n=1 Tax=Rubrobacter naiadicus TaxID=1392641 RepID=UPI00235EA706|nr:hypothetical protein [Rubrobacter naiadicus]MBX6765241.1 hypothetical protein [Rubrobacteraceae bacterium]MCL6439408.1 hypothetical protein [Rubrobacteraceae bacterium]
MQESIPRSWVGKDVILARSGASDSELVVLREVNDLGLAYAYKAGEVEGEPVFVPWTAVSWMRPPVPADLQGARDDG